VLGLLVAPDAALLWVILIGLGQGGTLGLSLILPSLRAATPAAVASLTAMMLCFGYLIASIGPWLLGTVHDLTGGWTAAVALFLALTVLELVPGFVASRRGAAAVR
jgi:CP family cyanate transporter-like MFS transporter